MKITTVLENNSRDEAIVAQYGLSLLVETDGVKILVDAGQDATAYENFIKLKLDAAAIDALLISHNHFDHIGGMQCFIDATEDRGIPIYVSSRGATELFSKRLFRRPTLVSRVNIIENNESRIQSVGDIVKIRENVYACRINSPDPNFLCKDGRLRMRDGARLVKDNFAHEIYLAVIENGAVKIVSSCSHNGVVNIVRDARDRFGLPIKAFVGGMHIRANSSNSLNCSKKHVKRIAAELDSLGLGAIYTCHCTGRLGFRIVKDNFSGKVKYFSAPDKFTV